MKILSTAFCIILLPSIVAIEGNGRQSGRAPSSKPLAITFDYPEEGSVFPPDFAAPTFIWRDEAEDSKAWRIKVEFVDGREAIAATAAGDRMHVGAIDSRCVAETNQPPTLTPRESAARIWKPDAKTWDAIKSRSVDRPATVTITGFADQSGTQVVSRGKVTILTSNDPVGAPIFYRDVPLMPAELEKGVIKPLVPSAVPLISWRLRNVAEPRSRLLLEGLPTCANCHSFSLDGKTMGMDVDGPQNDKGMYAIVPILPTTLIRSEDVFSWNSFPKKPPDQRTIGFMAQVSPEGRFAVTTLNEAMYVVNFKDYRFLQVFYPSRGIIAWYERATGVMKALPGADNPSFVQTDAVWSPDGEYLVFARAPAKDPYPEGRRLAEYANDPNELPVRYDLFRVPFNNGKGGRPSPVAGASKNGMSNSFPKVSPDGRWIVYVQARNGQLMRPDGKLFIVPAEGGTARRMRCNTPLMNSWHSFSPNSRWMVFASKSQSPYTRMYLTHIDKDGQDSPAILVEEATAPNRAVNIPEFLNVSPDALSKIEVPAAEFYRLFDSAWKLAEGGRFEASVSEWQRALALSPDDSKAHNNLGRALAGAGRFDEALTQWQTALDLNPEYAEARNNLGVALIRAGKLDEAIAHFRKILEVNTGYAEVHNNLGHALEKKGKLDKAVEQWQLALKINPGFAQARYNLGRAFYEHGRTADALAQWQEGLRSNPNDVQMLKQTAWILATSPIASNRNGAQAVLLAERALKISSAPDGALWDTLAAAYAETGRFADAVQAARRGLDLAGQSRVKTWEEGIRARLALYETALPYREQTRTATNHSN